METLSLSIENRAPRGKCGARQLRRDGRTPAVAYGHGIEGSLAVSLDPKELDKGLDNPKGANALFDVELDGATRKVLVREIQRHPVKRHILHVDLVAPDLAREVVTAVPVRVVGKSIGIQTGGKLRKPYREIRIRALPANVPAEVVVDITPLDHDDAIKASELALPEGVAAVFDRDFVVVKVVKPRGRKAEGAATK
jgi:large subunit ribosomal protein L25